MEISQRLLVGTYQEDAQHVVLGVFLFEVDIVERKAGANFTRVREVGDFSIAIAGNIGEHGGARWFLIQLVNRHHWEDLVDGPKIGEALEDAEITVVEVSHDVRQTIHLAVIVTAFFEFGCDPR